MNDVLFLVAGLVMIIKGGDFFVAAAVRIAKSLRMPRAVIGSTLVSLATTTPELVVSIMAGIKGESALAVGNAVGSVICNIGLILGIAALIRPVDVQFISVGTPLLAMFAAGFGLFVLTTDLVLSQSKGIVLLAAGIGYFAWDFLRHWRSREPVGSPTRNSLAHDESPEAASPLQSLPVSVAQFVVGAAVVVSGSWLLVVGAVGIAQKLGVPSIVIGLTIVAVGTSLPELITAITSSRKAVSDLALSNVLGANVANLTLIVGAAAVIRDVTMERTTQLFNFPAMLVMMALLLGMLLSGRRLTRFEGGVLVGAYGVYLALLLALTLPSPR